MLNQPILLISWVKATDVVSSLYDTFPYSRVFKSTIFGKTGYYEPK